MTFPPNLGAPAETEFPALTSWTQNTDAGVKYFSGTATYRKQLNAPGDPSAAVVSVQPGDGAIRNFFGGLDFEHNQFDVASQGERQPGSAFKPFVYLAALRENVDPRTQFDSKSPMDVPCNGETVKVRWTSVAKQVSRSIGRRVG